MEKIKNFKIFENENEKPTDEELSKFKERVLFLVEKNFDKLNRKDIYRLIGILKKDM
jgi:hypothetical protein